PPGRTEPSRRMLGRLLPCPDIAVRRAEPPQALPEYEVRKTSGLTGLSPADAGWPGGPPGRLRSAPGLGPTGGLVSAPGRAWRPAGVGRSVGVIRRGVGGRVARDGEKLSDEDGAGVGIEVQFPEEDKPDGAPTRRRQGIETQQSLSTDGAQADAHAGTLV